MLVTFAVWLGLSAVLVVVIRREYRHQISIQRARAERYTPWRVERYVIGTNTAIDDLGGRIESETVTTTWPQVAQWAAGRSMSPAVAEVYVIRRNAWWGITTWTWQNGRQIRQVPGYDQSQAEVCTDR
ncbi:hypothetical protein [Streptosporangium canum]|uniref:hypothetical protein n=1 Tax=Streptosporangium canum TaxID=324952 RepID=UPI0037BDAEC6